MYKEFKKHLEAELQGIRDAGLYKNERIITTPQRADIHVANTEGEVLNFCANNYLGLADDSRLIEAAKRTMDERGYGMSSLRLLRRQRRSLRAPLHRGGRYHLRLAQSRLDHRRRASLQG